MVHQRKPKRKRGGQPGNRNARTHGFYAAGLTDDEIGRLWEAMRNDGLPPEAAVLRIKLDTALERDPANRRVRRDAARLMARLYSARCGLDGEDGAVLGLLVRALLENASLTKRIETGAEDRDKTNRS